MTNNEKIQKHFEELIRLCKTEGILGRHTKVEINGKTYYVGFDFRGTNKEYVLKFCEPQITIQEDSKEDFKKLMEWTEEKFMSMVFVRLK